jgi:hypothetical protein
LERMMREVRGGAGELSREFEAADREFKKN